MGTSRFLILFIAIALLAVSGCSSDSDSGLTDMDGDQSVADGDIPVVDGDSDADLIDGDTTDGDTEQEIADPCNPNPCEDTNKTVCADDGEGNAVCSCDDGFKDYGDGSCKPSDPCDSDTACAGENRECENNQGVAECGDCLGGYHADGDACVEDVTCGDNTCNGHGDCTDDTGVPVCVCETGYVGDNCEACDTDDGWHLNAAGDACTTDPCDPTPCNAADHRVCEAGTGTCLCDTGFCDIVGVCVADGTQNPELACAFCDSATEKDDWSPRAANHECRASVGECDAAEVCDGIADTCPADANEIDGTSCDDGIDCTSNDKCSAGACSGTVYVCENSGTCNSKDDMCSCTIGYAGDYCENCAEGYTGDYCDECAAGYFSYPNCRIELGFVPIIAGTFWMGSPQSSTCPAGYPGVCADELGNYSSEVLHEVTLTYDFEMSRYEITEAQFEWLMGWNAIDMYDPDCNYGCSDDHPIQYISWYDTLAYANELSLDAGFTACYVLSNVDCENGGNVGSDYMNCFDEDATFGGIESATVMLAEGATKPQDCEGYRLPTEAEWEYAIRSGSEYTAFYTSEGNDGTITNIGEDQNTGIDPNLEKIGWYHFNNTHYGIMPFGTKPVGSKAANAFGLYDMSGNIREFTWDWYQPDYQNDVGTDPVGPSTGTGRVSRGGTWFSFTYRCRSAARSNQSPGVRLFGAGARLCRSLP